MAKRVRGLTHGPRCWYTPEAVGPACWRIGALVVACLASTACAAMRPHAGALAADREQLGAHDDRLASVALRSRLDAVAQVFRAHDARPFARRWTAFLTAAGSESMTVTTRRDQCLGFAAVGRESLRDIDLSIQNAAGARVAEDEHTDAHPYVWTCAHAGDTLFVVVRVGQGGGTGEVGLVAMANPPLVAPDLDRVVGVRVAGMSGPRQPRIAVGEDPASSDASQRSLALAARLEPLGYRLVRGIEGAFGTAHLREEYQRHYETVQLEASVCYALVLAGDGIDRLSLAIVPPDGPVVQAPEATDTTQLRVCTRRSGSARVAFQALSDGGSWNLALLAMDPAIELAGDVTGVERANALEIAGDARRHGMTLLGAPSRTAATDATYRQPVLLQAGRCYLFGAAASEQLAGLEVALADEHGVVLAADTSGDATGRVYHCATRTRRADVAVRALVGRGEFLLLAFESGASHGAGP